MRRQRRRGNKRNELKIQTLCLDFNSLFRVKFQQCLVLLILTFLTKLTWLRLDREFQSYLNEHSLSTMKNAKEKALSSKSVPTKET